MVERSFSKDNEVTPEPALEGHWGNSDFDPIRRIA